MKFGIHPINWSNDDFHELGGDIPLERCLAEMREAGFEGTELGNKFPRDPVELLATLKPYGLRLISGWHSTFVLSNELEEEKRRLNDFLDFLSEMGSELVILAECTGAIHGVPGESLGVPSGTDAEWERLTAGLDALADVAIERGFKPVYHHHMGTFVQTQAHVERLMEGTGLLELLLDTGHLLFAGGDPNEVYDKYWRRISHVHAKNLRFAVREEAVQNGWDFKTAVTKGVFTVPGDAGFDYGHIFKGLKERDYDGWIVIEAEQDPKVANPLEYGQKARAYLKQHFNL